MMKNGSCSRISLEKRLAIKRALVDPRFLTLKEIAAHVGVARTTVGNYKKYLTSNGSISSNPNFVLPVRGSALATMRRAMKRKNLMVEYVVAAAQRREKVSVNLLQKKFGGEKKLASLAIKEGNAIAESSKIGKVMRRTVADQS